MSGTTKRLDLQFGSFACSVQGFDDPVQPVQQVLQALQNLLEETPELGDAGISFDAEAIERLIGEVARRADLDERNVEIVPGLIIVHRTGDGAADYPDIADRSDEDTNFGRADISEAGFADAKNDNTENDADDTWLPLVADDAGEAEPAPPKDSGASDAADPGYVNIFSPGGGRDGEAAKPSFGLFKTDAPDPDDNEDEDDALVLKDDPFIARLGEISEPAAEDSADDLDQDDQKNDPARDIFADSGYGEASGDGDSVFSDPMAETGKPTSGDQDGPINFFSTADSVDRDVDDGNGNSVNLFASATQEEATEEPGQQNEDAQPGAALFGRTEDQPEAEQADEGYTAAGLAETAGAESVSDLMVSAAAWMVLIQGQTTFSRNQVVEVFEAMPGEHDKTLEARVKGFGKAVRNGQLVQVEDGIFGLSRTELERFQRLL